MSIKPVYFLLLLNLLLAACSTTTGPVTIRDVGAPTSTSPTEVEDDTVTVVQPVSPTSSQASTSNPLKEKLILQSQQKLQNQDANGAIALAERGLRVDRKEAYFYQLLAKAYRMLGNKKQSIHFAKQGLRYAPKNSEVYQSLKSLAD